MGEELLEAFEHDEALAGVIDVGELQAPGRSCGMKTALSPTASAGLMSDFGELPTIQVRAGIEPELRTSSR